MMDRVPDPSELKVMPWRPISAEWKARVFRSWFAFVGFDVGNWAIGFAFDVAPTGFAIRLCPLNLGFEREEPPPDNYNDLPDFGRTLYRVVSRKLKLELRLELDFNIWLLGYSMADAHDHGIYFGPFNLQIEYNKLFNEPDSLFLNARTLSRVHAAFVAWSKTARARLDIAVAVVARTERHIALAFDGINPAIGGYLTDRELSVCVNWEGRNWDLLISHDVTPRRSLRGYVCECCKPEGRTVFPNLEALWRDHLFEPFLVWVNEELAAADVIGLYGPLSGGVTNAALLSEYDPRRPDLCVPVRVGGSNDQ